MNNQSITPVAWPWPASVAWHPDAIQSYPLAASPLQPHFQ